MGQRESRIWINPFNTQKQMTKFGLNNILFNYDMVQIFKVQLKWKEFGQKSVACIDDKIYLFKFSKTG